MDLNLYLVIPLLCCIILVIILIISRISINKRLEKTENELKLLSTIKIDELKAYFTEEWKEQEHKLEQKRKQKENEINLQVKDLENNFKIKRTEIGGKLDKLKTILKEKEKRYEEVNQDLDLYRNGKIKEIDGTAAEYEKRKRQELSQKEEDYRFMLKQDSSRLQEQLQHQKETITKEIEDILIILEEERSKRAAINEEIRKNQEKEKYNEIHSVQLTDNEKEDIHFLLSLEDRLHNKQPLYKLIWSTYLQQAYKDTFNNILGNRNPKNVIYCIENINTGKKYIGKTSAEVSKRWTEHIKTSLNIGTIKSTNIHKALYNHWDEFIFYIIAETKKEKLSELEKYYINFYESDKYGYNIKAGG